MRDSCGFSARWVCLSDTLESTRLDRDDAVIRETLLSISFSIKFLPAYAARKSLAFKSVSKIRSQ
jgi:hypothetical protein